MRRRALVMFRAVGLIALAAAAFADPRAPEAPWSEAHPEVARDVRAGEPFVSLVVVPLCSNDQIWCGSRWAGQPGSLRANIYWGAAYGAKRYFDHPAQGWSLVEAVTPGRPVLERRVYRRLVPAERWGLDDREGIEQLVVLEAIHGSDIDEAVNRLVRTAANGATVELVDDGVRRRLRVHSVGYAGHNRLMDPVARPQPLRAMRPTPAFVLACLSEPYFGPILRQQRSATLVMTRTYMAPEGYVIDAVVRALGDNLPLKEVRQRTIAAYAKWQRIPESVAQWTFIR